MIESDPANVTVAHPDYGWEAVHVASRADGPQQILVNGQCIIEDCGFYVDDIGGDMVLLDRAKSFRKGGSAVVETRGHIPFGGETGFRQTCRYAGEHVRVTMDLRWRRGDVVRRHLGLGGLFLPGRWKRYLCVPPCLHLAEGSDAQWHTVPEEPAGSGMIGHWHRPPLALVFEREDGLQVEIGTGDDLWRWEENLEFGPEKGSYKLVAEPNGVRLIREPLMCCEEVTPRARDYRFTWYAAWGRKAAPEGADANALSVAFDASGEAMLPDDLATGGKPSLRIDFGALPVGVESLRVPTPDALAKGLRGEEICWHCNRAQKRARGAIRRIAGIGRPGDLHLRGLTPGPCWEPTHCDRKPGRAVPHWDVVSLLDFGAWVRQQLGRQWRISVDAGAWGFLPSVRGLARLNGFSIELDEPSE